MKKILVFCSIALFGLAACAQPQRKSPHDTVSIKDIKVTYGRPYKKGRVIFGGLEPYGKVYRLGADEATTIRFDKDGVFAGKPVKAGTYTLFALINEKQWTIILNSQLGQWGAFSYEKYKDKNVLQADIPVKKTDSVIEQFTIRFSGSNLIIEWDQTQVSIPYQF